MSAMKLTAAGDAMIFRRLPGAYAGFEAVRDFIARGDFRFCNLETTVHRYETYAAAVSGGSWFCAPPEVLEDMRAFGFNALSAANNHAMDYSHAGLLKTLSYIREAGFACAGTGATLADAAAPAYVDTLAGRFALIGACSTFHADAMAGEQTRSMPGRPGLNGVRHHTVYRLPEAQLRALRQIADDVMINAAADITRAEGYAPPLPANEAAFGDLRFEAAQEPGQHTCVNETDMLRVEKSIREARFMADYVVVAMHSHELRARSKEEPAAFYEQFARRCIDAGAHAVIGTGPHLLRPIEIYKGCPIFYSLGDFVLQLETIARAPADMYEKQGMTGGEGLDELFDARSGGGKRGLYYSKVMFESVVPFWEVENGVLTRLELLPVELGFGQPRSTGGWPRPRHDGGILERLAAMSEPYGTKIRVRDGVGTVEL